MSEDKKVKKVDDVEVTDTGAPNFEDMYKNAQAEIEQLKGQVEQYEKAYEALGKKYNKLNNVLGTVLNTYINSED